VASFKVRTVQIELKELETSVGISLDSVIVSASSVSLNSKTGSLEGPEPAEIRARVLPEAIQLFLESESPGGLQKFVVESLPGKLRVRAIRRMLIEIPVCAVCTLRIVDGKAVYVDVESVEVLQVNLENFVRSQIDKVNPIFTVDMLPMEATLRDVEITPLGITIRADAPVNFRI
jgi:hypothetical protein